jgi:hypothetical protein
LSHHSCTVVILTNQEPLLLRANANEVETFSVDGSQARISALSGDGSLFVEVQGHVRLWRTTEPAPLYRAVRSDESFRHVFLGPDGALRLVTDHSAFRLGDHDALDELEARARSSPFRALSPEVRERFELAQP